MFVTQNRGRGSRRIVSAIDDQMIMSPSSSSSLVLHRSNFSSSSSSLTPFEDCMGYRPGINMFTLFFAFSALFLLPLHILVLHLGHQRWKKQRSVSTMSHSDFFTYNTVVMEIVGLVGCGLFCCGAYISDRNLLMAGIYLYSVMTPGQTQFHVFTCLERFLAVRYPVTYMALRKGRGITLRNVSAAAAWLFSLSGLGVVQEVIRRSSSLVSFCFWTICMVLITFFSLSVISVLIRPRPGDGGGARSQSKQRAFNTIMMILGTLNMRCFGFFIACLIFSQSNLSPNDKCVVITSFSMFSIPSSSVLTLLFLHRAGKLPGCRPPRAG